MEATHPTEGTSIRTVKIGSMTRYSKSVGLKIADIELTELWGVSCHVADGGNNGYINEFAHYLSKLPHHYNRLLTELRQDVLDGFPPYCTVELFGQEHNMHCPPNWWDALTLYQLLKLEYIHAFGKNP